MPFWKKWAKPEPESAGPDFSDVDSVQKAMELHAAGQLQKLFLMPEIFGGVDNALNVLFVPQVIVDIKHRIDTGTISKLAEDGTITKYSAEPEYQGKSVVPISIKIRAWNPGEFTTTINIWGAALQRSDNATSH